MKIDLEQVPFNKVGIIEYQDNPIPVIFIGKEDKIPPPNCLGVDVNSSTYYSPELKSAFVKFTIDSDDFKISEEYYVDATHNMEFFDLLSKVWCFGIVNNEDIYLIQIPKIANLELIYEKLRKFKETGLVPYE